MDLIPSLWGGVAPHSSEAFAPVSAELVEMANEIHGQAEKAYYGVSRGAVGTFPEYVVVEGLEMNGAFFVKLRISEVATASSLCFGSSRETFDAIQVRMRRGTENEGSLSTCQTIVSGPHSLRDPTVCATVELTHMLKEADADRPLAYFESGSLPPRLPAAPDPGAAASVGNTPARAVPCRLTSEVKELVKQCKARPFLGSFGFLAAAGSNVAPQNRTPLPHLFITPGACRVWFLWHPTGLHDDRRSFYFVRRPHARTRPNTAPPFMCFCQ